MALAPDGSLYVGDFGNDRVQHFSADLEFINQWSMPPPPDQFHPAGPDAMAFDPSGRLWIAWASSSWAGDFHAGRIIAYDSDGTELTGFPVEADPSDTFQQNSSWFFRDIAFDPAGQLWVLLYSSSEGARLIHFDEYGNQVTALPLPDGTDQYAFLPDGTLVVSTSGQLTAQHPAGFSWVEYLTASGQPIGDWGDTWWAADRATSGMLAWSKHVAFDREGRILVAGGFSESDASYNVVPAFSFLNRYLPDGDFDATLFSETDPPESNWYIAVAPDGTVVRSSRPFGIDRDGNRYTLDNSDHLHAKVRKTDASGTLIAEWDLGGGCLYLHRDG